jgi:iron complex outermembrane receptor protein
MNTVGNDGKPHDQIPYRIQEETDAQYLKFDYASRWVVSTSTATSAGVGFTPGRPPRASRRARTYAATNGGTATTYVLSNSLRSYEKDYTVWLPSFNVGLWFIPNKLSARFGFAELMARPRLDFLLPTVTCTTDASPDAAGEFDEPSCTPATRN